MTATLSSSAFASAQQRLDAIGQGHLLAFAASLSAQHQAALASQVASLDLASLPKLIQQYVLTKPEYRLPTALAPAIVHALNGTITGATISGASHATWDKSAAHRAGEKLIAAGKVAAFVVAGGQGSRLGYEGPKGCFPAGCVTNKPLFQIFAENLLGIRDRYNVEVPWYIMTSPLNNAATQSFFAQHNFFGLSRSSVKFFEQGVSPSIDMQTGKVLLTSKHEIATNPDGHGGAVRALHISGALQDMRERGIEQLSYFQVDNPHVRIIDPVFIGLHAFDAHSSNQMSSKMVSKAGPDEKVGVFVLGDGRTQVLEYSDMPKHLQEARDEQGNLRYSAGSVAIHMLSRSFVEKLATDEKFELPWHRAEKKIPCVNPVTGEAISPTTNNGVKLEKFIFDALPLCDKSLVMEVSRTDEFAPIKNATGTDSVESSKQLQTLRASNWLQACGIKIPKKADGSPDCAIEISPRTATSPEELAASLPKLAALPAFTAGSRIAL